MNAKTQAGGKHSRTASPKQSSTRANAPRRARARKAPASKGLARTALPSPLAVEIQILNKAEKSRAASRKRPSCSSRAQAAFSKRVEHRWPLDITHAVYVGDLKFSRLNSCGLLALGIVRSEALWRELHGLILAGEQIDINGAPASWRAGEIGVALVMATDLVRRMVLNGVNDSMLPDSGLSFPALPGLAGLVGHSWDDIATALASAYVNNAEEITGWLIPRVQDGALRVELAELLMIADIMMASYLLNSQLCHHAGDRSDPSEIQERAWSAFAVASGLPGRP